MVKNEERKVDFVEEGPDLSPGFFSSYGYGNGALIHDEPETGRKYRWRDGKKVYEE